MKIWSILFATLGGSSICLPFLFWSAHSHDGPGGWISLKGLPETLLIGSLTIGSITGFLIGSLRAPAPTALAIGLLWGIAGLSNGAAPYLAGAGASAALLASFGLYLATALEPPAPSKEDERNVS